MKKFGTQTVNNTLVSDEKYIEFEDENSKIIYAYPKSVSLLSTYESRFIYIEFLFDRC